jgi:hypothetical protein
MGPLGAVTINATSVVLNDGRDGESEDSWTLSAGCQETFGLLGRYLRVAVGFGNEVAIVGEGRRD